MKKSIILKFLTACLGVIFYSFMSQQTLAQVVAGDFSAPQYQAAIDNIAVTSDGRLTPAAIRTILSNGLPQMKSDPVIRSITVDPIITVSPVIDVVSFDGIEDAVFTVTSGGGSIASITITFSPSQPGWIPTSPVVSGNTISIDVLENPSAEARSTGIIIGAFVNGSPAAPIPAYIIQEGNPGAFIMVSPEVQAISYLGGVTAPFNVIHFNIDGWEVVEPLPYSITIADGYPDGDLIAFDVPQNNEDNYRMANITIREVGNPPGVSDQLTIFQGAQSVSTILVTPEIQAITYEAQTSAQFSIINFNIEDWEVDESTLPVWITSYNGNHDADWITFSVLQNDGNTFRQATIKIQATDDPDVFDELSIFQGAESPQPFIFIDPEIRSISYEGGNTLPFTIVHFNIDDWEVVDSDNLPYGITIAAGYPNEDLIAFNVPQNNEDTYREAVIVIQEAGGGVSDTLTIIQGALSESVILITPEVQSVNYAAQTTAPFTIINFNINGWEVVDSGSLPFGITIADGYPNGDLIAFNVPQNYEDTNRTADIVIQEEGGGVSDTLTIVQGAFSESVILISPEVQSVTYAGGITDTFNIIHFNIEDWVVDPATLPDWISVADSSQSDDPTGDYITFSVDTNELDAYRQHTITIQETGGTGISDQLTIYQGALAESVILISPEVLSVSFAGGITDTFNIIHFNIEDWEVDLATLPDWISVADSSQSDDHTTDYITFSVDTNELDSYRDATIRIREINNQAIFDELTIYQGALSESVILITPEVLSVSYAGGITDTYNIIHFNIEDWEVDPATLPDWISVADSSHSDDPTLDFITFSVDTNELDEYRQHTITIQEAGNPAVTDSLTIYQGALSESVILITPEIQSFDYQAHTTDQFNIIHFNIEDWEVVESTIPGWISSFYDDHVEDFVTFTVMVNEEDTYREALITIQETGNPAVSDQLLIVQGALSISTILVYPEIQAITYDDQTTAPFDIIHFNIENWEVDPASLPGWILSYDENHEDDYVTFHVEENEGDAYREDTITIRETGGTGISDQLVILQDAFPQSYLLAAPRSAIVGHEGGNAFFQILRVNIDVQAGWTVSDVFYDPPTSTGWISTDESQQEILSVTIEPSDVLYSRWARIRIAAVNDDNVFDEVTVYQYSDTSSYILLAPREKVFPWNFTSESAEIFMITAVNTSSLSYDISYDPPGQSGWVSAPEIINDEFIFYIGSENNSIETRVAVIKIFDEMNPATIDSVHVYQRSSFDPYIILMPAAKDRINYRGGSFPIRAYSNFEKYFVYRNPVDSWYSINDDLSYDTLYFDDDVVINVDTNYNAFKSRSSVITFQMDTVITSFYLRQLNAPAVTVKLSGRVMDSDTTGIEGVTIYADPDSTLTDMNGYYELNVLKGWQGTVIPKNKTHYFNPAQIVIDKIGGIDIDTSNVDFRAFRIDPQVTMALNESFICEGESLDNSQIGKYPGITIQGTYGIETYKWSTDPAGNESSISNTAIPDPVFSPAVTTTYIFELTNNDSIASDTFTLIVKILPLARDFSGEVTVCRNQGGMVYTVDEFGDEDYFLWELPEGGGGIVKDSTKSIVVINWGSVPGTYELSLTTLEDGCAAAPVIRTITISEKDDSPVPAKVDRKSDDNFLFCNDTVAIEYKWGWFRQVNTEIVGGPNYFPGKNQWYCRLPDGYSLESDSNRYFVETRHQGMECSSRAFYDPTVSINEFNTGQIVVYPNPADQVINVRFNENINLSHVKLRIFDFTGKLVYLEDLSDVKGNTTLAITEAQYFKAGIYLLSIQTDKWVHTTKIIVR